jgi:hypothetical protein
MKKYLSLTFVTALAAASLLAHSGCATHQGPAERAGEKIDRAVEDVQDAVNPPGPAEKAGRNLDRTMDNLTD